MDIRDVIKFEFEYAPNPSVFTKSEIRQIGLPSLVFGKPIFVA